MCGTVQTAFLGTTGKAKKLRFGNAETEPQGRFRLATESCICAVTGQPNVPVSCSDAHDLSDVIGSKFAIVLQNILYIDSHLLH